MERTNKFTTCHWIKVLCSEQYSQQIMKSLSDLGIHFYNVFFENVLIRSPGQCLNCYSYNMKRRLVYMLMASEITCSLKQIKQCRQMTPLCWHCWGGLVLQLIGGSKHLQPERVISGSCNYPPGYLPSDPTSRQSIV